MLTRFLLAATLLAGATAVQAAPSYTMTGGGSAPATSQTVIFDFDTTFPVLGANVIIQSGNNGNGAPPAFANPGGDYLSVLTGGIQNFTFASPVAGFSFDWGSIDTYNTLTIFGSAGTVTFTGADFGAPADGDQQGPHSNGLFLALGGGDTFTGFRLESSRNSFEIDNVAIGAIPEPATWAMMIAGVGAIGGALRRRGARRASLRFA